jgi:hypothetical protein
MTTHSTTLSNPQSNSQTWIVDSASNANLTPYLERLDEYVKFDHPQVIKGIGGMTVDALGSGYIIITDWNDREVTINDVFYVPKATDPILSMQKLRKNNIRIVFDDDDRDIDKFVLNSYEEDFNLAGRSIDNILYVTESENSYRSLQVSTRAQKRRRLDRIDESHHTHKHSSQGKKVVLESRVLQSDGLPKKKILLSENYILLE